MSAAWKRMDVSVSDFVHSLEGKLRERLPPLNLAVEANSNEYHHLESEIRSWLKPDSIEAVVSQTETHRDGARAVLGVLELCVASLERHSQGVGRKCGEALSSFPGLGTALVRLGKAGRHPPRGSHATSMALASQSNPITPLGLSGEVYFWRTVRESEVMMSKCTTALRPLRTFELSVAHKDAAIALSEAARPVEELWLHFRNFRLPAVPNGDPRLKKFDFARLRQYLLPIQINGVRVNGPNPAHVGGWPLMDAAIGMIDDDYFNLVRGRYEVMLGEDIDAFECEGKLPSITSILALEIASNFGPADWLTLDPCEIASELDRSFPGVGAALLSYRRLVRAAKSLTGTHWALVQNYVVRATQGLSEEERKKLPIAGGTGVSGRPVEETERLMNMRRNHVHVERLIEIGDAFELICANRTLNYIPVF